MHQLMNEFDLFYISYDEPKCEEHWAKLLDVAPWAKRVHGVKGFDAAHKACAAESETDKFITVDGDNLIDPSFLELTVDIPEKWDDCVLSWASENAINGLVYGNGGLKLWPKKETLLMNTHENAADERFALDFCWDDKYIQMNNVYSTTHPNGSPFQAFRAGFREGCKMTVNWGSKVDVGRLATQIHLKNLKRLMVWMSVGADTENGLWAIFGARLGLIEANTNPNFDVNNIRDYDWFKEYFHTNYNPDSTAESLIGGIHEHGNVIRKATGLKPSLLDADQSQFFKFVYEAPKRVNAFRTEIEVDSEK